MSKMGIPDSANVTAEEIKHWLATGDGPDEGYPGWTKRLGETALRGLDLGDTMERATGMWADRILRGVIRKAVKKFKGSDDG